MEDAHVDDKNLTIILASVIPGVAFILLCAILLYQIQKRRARLFRRGITPIGEEEIQSWKVDKDDEQSETLEQGPSHQRGNSASSHKPASIIVYQNTTSGRVSEDQQPHPTSPPYRVSIDIPTTPVVARAPNARPGLTDDTIPGDDAFILQPKRQTRLAKHPPVSAASRHHRAWSTRSISRRPSHECWYGTEHDGTPPRHSTETFTRSRSRSLHQASNNSTAYSTPAKPPRASFDDEMFLGGLSPRPPVHKSEIGRAIG
ncbi:hypothetical protein ISF_04292 [Cordyceps fumosorosea ARSEF 2679]|uniref:Uncharacterized protein n=1 Tax=Cordyceps fumosorosea (strain ARSEF 2679) TaxID=1081104 RepID=A0A162J7J4_CORFA|nr:hypothetical protein ISF_04292 [Cordyceps fumosorosea ARSEF 2679]OAA64882.1 hypothetical protein ISF_04292 [Cordyceps fumosorosea ARSEF 2679]